MKVLRVWFRDGISVGRVEETRSVLSSDKNWELDWDAKLRELTVVESDSGFAYTVPVENIKLMRKDNVAK
jgi:hypothetical protein